MIDLRAWMYKIKITKTGFYLPPRIQNNWELGKLINRSEQWITSRTGVLERHISEEPMHLNAAKAVRNAMADEPPPDCILNASVTPMQLIPDSSVFIQEALGYSGIPCWSIHATCLSFLVALHSAAVMIHAGSYKRILIVSSEVGSGFRNMNEPESAALIGDGAAAVLVESTPDSDTSAWLDWEIATWPEGKNLTEFRGAGILRPPYTCDKTVPEDYFFHMKGPKVFKMARKYTGIILDRLMTRNRIKARDIDWLIPHQASGPALKSAPSYGIDKSKLVNIIEKTGNTIAASTPMAMAWAHQKDLLKRNDLVLIGGSGAGLSIAYALIRW
ncbi:ketoacyl-ACP synthase III [bacterium]|nr:ketoacyl-ACP synthase III [bacterium]